MGYLRKLLLENEATEGIGSPMDYLYVKILRFTLLLVNSWPSRELGERQSSFKSSGLSLFLSILIITYSIGGILYLVLRGSFLSFLDIGNGYITTFMNIVILSRLLTLTFSIKYRDLAKIFWTNIHLFYYKDVSEYAMQTHRRVHMMSHLFSLWLATQTFVGVIFYNIIPVYNFFSMGYHRDSIARNLTYETSVYIIYPFDTYSSTVGYLVIGLCNFVFSSLAAIWFCMFDLHLCLMVFHVWGHFSILLHKLDTFPRPYTMELGCEKYTPDELIVIFELLKDCINYHRLVVSFTKKMSETFGTMLFVYYTFHQVSGCLLLLECSQTGGALIRYVPMTLILNQQLIQLSVIFELIATTSEKLKHGVHGLPWELMDVKNRKTVLFFLMNVQKPIHVKALGLANVGVNSMATILKTSLSYFTFLRSM